MKKKPPQQEPKKPKTVCYEFTSGKGKHQATIRVQIGKKPDAKTRAAIEDVARAARQLLDKGGIL